MYIYRCIKIFLHIYIYIYLYIIHIKQLDLQSTHKIVPLNMYLYTCIQAEAIIVFPVVLQVSVPIYICVYACVCFVV